MENIHELHDQRIELEDLLADLEAQRSKEPSEELATRILQTLVDIEQIDVALLAATKAN
jgi:hypothetical protein